MRIILAIILALLMAPLSEAGIGIGTTGGVKNVVTKLDAKVQAQQDQKKLTQTPSAPFFNTNQGDLAVSSTQINLSWVPSTVQVGLVTNYQIYRNASATPVATSTSTTYNDTGLTAGTAYTYTVSACSSAGYCSAQSNSVTAPTPKWIFSIAGQSSSNAPAIDTNGIIYSEGGSNLYAINPNGTQKWAFATGLTNTSPAIDANGIIYTGGGGTLYAINPNGTQKWNFATGAGGIYTPAVGADGTIYAGSYNVGGFSSNLHSISPIGVQNWTFATGGGAPIIAPDGTIYVGGGSNLYAINPNGTQKWALALSVNTESAAIGADGTIFAGDGSSLHAISPAGTENWTFATGGGNPAIGSDGTIYVGGYGKLFAINPDGTQKWVISGPGGAGPVIGMDGTILVGYSFNPGIVFAINSDGTQKWGFELGNGNLSTSIAIGADGTIYAGSGTAGLYAIPGTTPLANSVWPKFHHDLLNSGL